MAPKRPKARSAFKPAMEGVTIRRDAPIMLHDFTDYFQGFERVKAVRDRFGERTEEVLNGLKVEFFSSRFGFMGVSEDDGHIMISTHYLMNGDEREIYLDIIHELVHVKQFQEGKKFFPEGIEYPDLPTEIEAYKIAVAEAERIGLTEEEILEYLKVPWMDNEAYARLLTNIGIEVVTGSD